MIFIEGVNACPGGESSSLQQWRHDGRDSVSNNQPHDCLLNRLFRRRSKKTSKLCVTGLCARNSPVAGEKCFHLMTSSWSRTYQLELRIPARVLQGRFWPQIPWHRWCDAVPKWEAQAESVQQEVCSPRYPYDRNGSPCHLETNNIHQQGISRCTSHTGGWIRVGNRSVAVFNRPMLKQEQPGTAIYARRPPVNWFIRRISNGVRWFQ